MRTRPYSRIPRVRRFAILWRFRGFDLLHKDGRVAITTWRAPGQPRRWMGTIPNWFRRIQCSLGA